MRFRASPIPTSPVGEINVTPLIDVVMCLIIFFLLVGTLSTDAPVRLPQTATGQADSARSITLTILAPTTSRTAAAILLDGEPLTLPTSAAPDPSAAPTSATPASPSIDELAQAIAAHAQARGFMPASSSSSVSPSSPSFPSSPSSPSFTIRIRADRTLPYSVLDPILSACAKLGLPSVRLVTERPS